MIIGPDIALVREYAKAQVQKHYVALGEKDGTQPALRAMYVLKVEQAKRVLAGDTSLNFQIEREADRRGWTAFQMATVILHMAGESIELEDERIGVNLAIDGAASEAEIVAILEGLGLTFAMELQH